MGWETRVPNAWIMRRHSLSVDGGQVILADRRAQRMELSWQCPRLEPDVPHSLENAIAKLRGEQPGRKINQLPSIKNWMGLVYGENPRIYRALHFDRTHRVLLQATLSLDGNRETTHAWIRQILASTSVTARPEDATRWTAFGIDCTVPSSCMLTDVRVVPMDAQFRFKNRSGDRLRRRSASFRARRLGMARDWFDGNMEAWVRGRALGPEPTLHTEGGGPDRVVQAESERPLFPFLCGLGPREKETLWAWFHGEMNSVYVATLLNGSLVNWAVGDFRLRACPEGFLNT